MQHDPKQTAILTYLSLYATPCAAWMDGETDAASLAAEWPQEGAQSPARKPDKD